MDLRKRILIIEDDEDIALSLKYNLEKDGGYLVQSAPDGESGIREAAARAPDLLILDLNLPGMDGLSICRTLRRRPETAAVPIIMLTARVEESDRIVGLEIGADDYVTKPFSMKEMIARVRAVLRRTERGATDPRVYADGLIQVDPASHVVKVAGDEIVLTRKEFELLTVLVANQGRVMSREQLLQRIWGHGYFGETRTVDVHIRRLRMKLGEKASAQIETVVGVGYRFRAAE